MSAAEPAGAPHADVPSDLGSETAGAADLSLHALAVAADPTLAGLPGAYPAGQAYHAYDGGDLGQGDTHFYDSHVALVLDPGLLPDIDSMLDLLTSSHDLFDVPAMDIGGALDDATST